MSRSLVLSLVLATLMALSPSGAWAASDGEGTSQCPVDAVPIQFVYEAQMQVSVSRQWDSDIRIPSSSEKFSGFALAITEHVATQLAKNKLCVDSAESRERSLLQFMEWRLLEDRSSVLVLPLDARPSGGCRISSPWIDLAFERKPIPWIRGMVRWNERQMVADQAVMAGVQNVPSGVAKPLTNRELVRFAHEYYESSVAEQRIPPDLLWIFRRSMAGAEGALRFGATPFGGSPTSEMSAVVKKSAESYTKLVIALIDRCFASEEGADFHYSSILDAADLISLEQYKIDD